MSFRVLLSTPDVGELEQDYVLKAMKSGWVAPAGPDLDAFEAEMAARVGRAHGVALSSGTAALHLALVSWGVGPGDVVPVSTLTFAATVNAIRYVGAEPYFVDSETESGNLSVALLDQALTSLLSAGRRVPCVVPVDLLGKCVDYTALLEVARRHGVRVLADAAEALGARHAGRPAGAFGDAAVLSFNGNKIMTTSGGGMLVTDDEHLAAHVRKLSTQAREPVAHYEHTEVGYNYRLSNLLAALGRAQLTRLDEMIGRRRVWRERYRDLVAGMPGCRVLGGATDADDNCWLTAVVIDPDRAEVTASELHRRFVDAGVESRPLWKPMHRQPVYAGWDGLLDGTSDELFARGLTLPSGSAMTESDFSYVTDVLESVRR
jgi:dTDP-4-amino-4,6-dideoxygalactose transaminase